MFVLPGLIAFFALVRMILLFIEAKGWNGLRHGSPT